VGSASCSFPSSGRVVHERICVLTAMSMRRKHFNEDKRQRTNVQSKQVTARVK
jgi:hypothetical protein